MHRILPIALVAAVWTVPADAQLNSYYKGVVRDGAKDVPATAQFSVEPGRAAMILRGATTRRMLYIESEQVLRLVDDARGSYLDLGKASGPGSIASGIDAQMAEMRRQLDRMPPAQRGMMEQMMRRTMGATEQPPDQYVWSTERKTIAGYEATRVDILQGGVKKSEYWGTPSADFKMSDAERKTMLAMQEYLRNSMIGVSPVGGGARAFQWDTSVDGYPVLTRCFNGDEMTLELQLDSVDRKPVSGDLFAIPSSYKKQEMPTIGGR